MAMLPTRSFRFPIHAGPTRFGLRKAAIPTDSRLRPPVVAPCLPLALSVCLGGLLIARVAAASARSFSDSAVFRADTAPCRSRSALIPNHVEMTDPAIRTIATAARSDATSGVRRHQRQTLSNAPTGLRQNRLAIQESTKIVGQFGSRSIAPVRLLSETLQANRLKIARHLRIQQPWRNGFCMQHLIQRYTNESPRNGGRPVTRSYNRAPNE